jgi:hypothetical protein
VLEKYGLASAAGVLLPEGECLALKRLVQVFINDEWLLFLTHQWHEAKSVKWSVALPV